MPAAADRRATAPAESTRASIALFEERVARNPRDAASWVALGRLYREHSRESGAPDLIGHAEAALRRARALLPDEPPATLELARVLYDQHRFGEALALVDGLDAAGDRSAPVLALRGDAALALGAYPRARAAYRELAARDRSPPVLVRLAQLAELDGDLDVALELAEEARASVAAEDPTAAWYALRSAELRFDRGELGAAAALYRSILAAGADAPFALAGLARVRAAEGKLDEATSLLARAVERHAEPESLARLGDLEWLRGREDEAERWWRRAEELGERIGRDRSIYARQLVLFWANHDRRSRDAVALARREVAMRRDVYAFDALAWALFKAGEIDEAAEWIERALAPGTRDAALWYHASLIAEARGQRERAFTLLERALALNPGFDPYQARFALRARERLAPAIEAQPAPHPSPERPSR